MVACIVAMQPRVYGQKVNLESSIISDSLHKMTNSFQRVEIKIKFINLKYDYKAEGRDVLGIIIPKIWSDSSNTWSAMIVKVGDGGRSDQFTFDTWMRNRIGAFSSMVEIGRVVGSDNIPKDYFGGRWNYRNFTLEFYKVLGHPINQEFANSDLNYGWFAYHPKHVFIALGKQDNQYWGFVGTKNLRNFGTFNLLNYQPKTGNFWFRSQNGFGQINQDFFAQETYVDGAEYLVVPLFYAKHFSPICAKGTYSLRIDGRRTNDFQNYEVIMGKEIGNNLFRVATGITSEYRQDLHIAPSFELYKDWQTKGGRVIGELRYDMLYKALSIYLTVRY